MILSTRGRVTFTVRQTDAPAIFSRIGTIARAKRSRISTEIFNNGRLSDFRVEWEGLMPQALFELITETEDWKLQTEPSGAPDTEDDA